MDDEIARAQEQRRNVEDDALAAVSSVPFDADLYGGVSDPDRFAGYETSIAATAEDDDDDDDATEPVNPAARSLASYSGHAIASSSSGLPRAADEEGDGLRAREGEYHRRHPVRGMSPDRHDPFAAAETTPDPSTRTYADATTSPRPRRSGGTDGTNRRRTRGMAPPLLGPRRRRLPPPPPPHIGTPPLMLQLPGSGAGTPRLGAPEVRRPP
jgi:hypothetical protein